MDRATILIVDDEPACLSVLTHVLQAQYRVRAVNSGQRALQAAATAVARLRQTYDDQNAAYCTKVATNMQLPVI
jgi:CheY-like chemotaxis protein